MSSKEFDYSYTQNRELSWLKFNERVLEEAQDTSNPLMERMKFIAIVNSNLDEFFMIRVGSITDLMFVNPKHKEDKQGMTPSLELSAIYLTTHTLVKKRDNCFKQIEQELELYNIRRLNFKHVNKSQRKYLEHYFYRFIEPILSPQIIDPHHPFPHLENKALYVALRLKDKQTKVHTFGIVPIPKQLVRVILLEESTNYVLVEDLIAECLCYLYKQYDVIEHTIITVTRNADIGFDSQALDQEDITVSMKKLLKKRMRLQPVRLEVYDSVSRDLLDFLMEKLSLTDEKVFVNTTPLDCSYIYSLKDLFSGKIPSDLYYSEFKPQHSCNVNPNMGMIEQILSHDILLFYPYETMDDYIRLIQEAARDPQVVSIKITIYRLAKKAKLIKYLCEAAENGKEVTVLMELRARFDEENNINWAENLEESGCRIMYGFENFKVHSKITCITRIQNGKMQIITQVGTGNYNENTAKMYTDISFLTANEQIGKDSLQFFNNMAVSDLNGTYHHLLVAPNSLKNKILEKIDIEIMKAQMGQVGEITMKLNSLTDRDIIDKFVQASVAGVKVRLIIRGICCLLPNIKHKTDNIYITGIVGRFLEHSRIYVFGCEQNCEMYISSADMMTRNTEKRVEIAAPILDDSLKKQIWDFVHLQLEDNVKARIIDSSGNNVRKIVTANTNKLNSQQAMMDLAIVNANQKIDDKSFNKPKSTNFVSRLKEFFKTKSI